MTASRPNKKTADVLQHVDGKGTHPIPKEQSHA